jgi:ABC-type cobalamin/Fe3+-siderophores transport system ATPase subunit
MNACYIFSPRCIVTITPTFDSVMGASAAGKSVLLKTLSGRLQELTVRGGVYIDGARGDVKRIDNPVAYVPQEGYLNGELTAREVTINNAMMKRNEPREKLDRDVDELLGKLGLAEVADGIIGTLIFVSLIAPVLHHHAAYMYLSPLSLSLSFSSCFAASI